MDDDEAHALGAVHEQSWFNTLGEFTLGSDLVLTDDYWKCFCDHDNLVKVEFSSESTFSTPCWGQGVLSTYSVTPVMQDVTERAPTMVVMSVQMALMMTRQFSLEIFIMVGN